MVVRMWHGRIPRLCRQRRRCC